MKRFLILNFSLLFCLVFAGCGNNRQALPENPIIFNETEIDWHWAIENDWKYYLAYSTIKPKWVIWDFNYALWDCLWYVWDDSNDRIYELSGESSDEWLINYYVNGEMEIPTILRWTSTRYKDYIPESVDEVLEEDRYWIKPEPPMEANDFSPEHEQYRFYSRKSSEKDNVYITVDTTNLTQDQKYLAENYKMKTNDPSRKILVLNVWKEPVDRNTFKPFWDVSEEYIAKLPEWEKEEYLCRIPWKDNKNLYLESCDYSVSKKELPWYTMFGTLWIQAVDWFIWYSNWYLVSFPYKFPVDAKTFVEGGLRDKIQNNWLQYHHYIWSDKNYFYTREDYDTIVIKRTPKSWDFKLLGTGEYWKYVYDKETWLEDVSSEFSYDEVEEWNYVMGEQYPPIYKSGNYLYIAPWYWWEYNYWIRRFPVDIETLKEEKFKDTYPINEYITTYYVLSDKDYYYQIIENENWYRIFQRIKK